VSPSGLTHVWEVCEEKVTEWEIDPRTLGLECRDLDDLAGGEPVTNAERIERLLAGDDNTPAIRCAVLLNAAAGLYVSGQGLTFHQAVECARVALDSGAGGESLERLKRAAPAAVPT
jgi:anthranilate phosphoribosyltransferase